MAGVRELIELLASPGVKDVKEVLRKLPGKDCGLCGARSCEEFAELIMKRPEEVWKCVYLHASHEARPADEFDRRDMTWKDALGRPYDFVLDKLPEDPGPRETIVPFNPLNVERLGIRNGDVLYGRPAWTGCPITHSGTVMEEPDRFNGVITWCVTGPLLARQRGIDIGYYDILAYEGMVRETRVEVEFGRRYDFLPRYCMLQSRHSGLVNMAIRTAGGIRVRIEGIWIS